MPLCVSQEILRENDIQSEKLRRQDEELRKSILDTWIMLYGEDEGRKRYEAIVQEELRRKKFWDTAGTIISAIIVIAVWILSLQK